MTYRKTDETHRIAAAVEKMLLSNPNRSAYRLLSGVLEECTEEASDGRIVRLMNRRIK